MDKKFKFTNERIRTLPANPASASSTDLEVSDAEVIGLKGLSGKSGNKCFLLTVLRLMGLSNEDMKDLTGDAKATIKRYNERLSQLIATRKGYEDAEGLKGTLELVRNAVLKELVNRTGADSRSASP